MFLQMSIDKNKNSYEFKIYLNIFLNRKVKVNSGFIIHIQTVILFIFVLFKLQKKMNKNA